MRKTIGTIAIALALIAITGGCLDNKPDAATASDKRTVASGLANLNQAQPLHTYGHSVIRSTLQTAEDIQANGENTWTYGFEMGITAPVFSCPSIGLPVPATDQLTNPLQSTVQSIDNADDQAAVIAQADPTGVYSGATDATYVVCIADGGEKYLSHFEGQVDSFTQRMEWNGAALVPAADAHSSVTIPGKVAK